jgi:uncharacterized protein YigA (DUF484 family)
MKLNSEDVAQYLYEHPEFFEEYAPMLAEIQVSDSYSGRAIPISERQILALREKNRILHNRLSELIGFGEENDAITEKMHRLTVALLTFTRLNDFLHGLNVGLRELFSVPHTALRIWNMTSDDPGLAAFTAVTTETHTMAENLQRPYCGPHVPDEIRNWFGESAAHLRSFAMVALRHEQTIGLLVMGSEDPERFYPEMGTIYLTHLGELASATLGRFRTD